MSKKVKAIVFTNPGEIELNTFDLPPCGPDEIVCETIYSFVSPGTELRVLSGVKESKGKFPFIPGYSWVGRVVEVGRDLKGWELGDLVTGGASIPISGVGSLWGGQASYHRVSGYDGSVLKLPAGSDPWDYITVEVASIAWRGVTCAYPAPGETAVVIGQGLIGALSARWLIQHGARVIVTDIVEARLERARQWGVAAAVEGGLSDTRERILNFCPRGADIVIEASSSVSGAQLAGSLLRQPAPRVMNTSYPVTAMHSNAHFWPRLVFLATYSQTLQMGPDGLSGTEGAVVLKPLDRTVDDRLAVIELIRRGALPAGDILTKPTPVDKAQSIYLQLRDHPDQYSAVAFEW